MARVIRRALRWAVVAVLVDAVLRAARKGRARTRPEPAIEPAWPALKGDEPAVTVNLDEPPAPLAPEVSWIAPEVDGSCPDGYPVKVKERSGIYHSAGMLNYERTTADRCYASEAAAEADGYRPAKR